MASTLAGTANNETVSKNALNNAMYVKGATLTLSTTDTTRPYLVSYLNIDNACSGTPDPVTDECLTCYKY